MLELDEDLDVCGEAEDVQSALAAIQQHDLVAGFRAVVA